MRSATAGLAAMTSKEPETDQAPGSPDRPAIDRPPPLRHGAVRSVRAKVLMRRAPPLAVLRPAGGRRRRAPRNPGELIEGRASRQQKQHRAALPCRVVRLAQRGRKIARARRGDFADQGRGESGHRLADQEGVADAREIGRQRCECRLRLATPPAIQQISSALEASALAVASALVALLSLM